MFQSEQDAGGHESAAATATARNRPADSSPHALKVEATSLQSRRGEEMASRGWARGASMKGQLINAHARNQKDAILPP
jgi:hypothetical protein